MFRIRLRRKRSIAQKVGSALSSVPVSLKARRKLPGPGYLLYALRLKAGRAERKARYAAEDAAFGVRRMRRYSETIVFAIVILIAAVMLLNAGSTYFLISLVALLMLVLIVIVYMDLRMQKTVIDQYIPRIGHVYVKACMAFADRMRVVNIYGAADRLGEMRKVRNIRIRYRLLNDSFAPVSVGRASLEVALRKGGRISLPPSSCILEVEPKRSATTEVSFRLQKELDFDSIAWLGLGLEGSSRKSVRMEPRLYVNLMLRGKEPEQVFEPFKKFSKRPEVAEALSGKGPVGRG